MINVLFLGPETSPVFLWLAKKAGVACKQTEAVIMRLSRSKYDVIVSHGYRHMVSNEIVSQYSLRAINLHASLLPWNRGADPNFWSFAYNTPSGATIHLINGGLDKGDIIAQERIVFTGSSHTLRSTYRCLQVTLFRMFKELWPKFIAGQLSRMPQVTAGSYHNSVDKKPYEHLLTRGWDTPIAKIRGCAGEVQDSQHFWGKYDKEVAELNECNRTS